MMGIAHVMAQCTRDGQCTCDWQCESVLLEHGMELREVDLRSGAKKEKCKYTADWVDAQAERRFVLRGGVPPKKKGGGKKKK